MKTASLVLPCLLLVSAFAAGQQSATPESGSHDLSSTGAAFLRVCDKSPESPDAGHIRALCMAYVAGVSDGAQLLAIRQLPMLPFCLTPEADNWQLFRAVVQYLKAHPEKTDSPTRNLTLDALTAAFPCHSNR